MSWMYPTLFICHVINPVKTQLIEIDGLVCLALLTLSMSPSLTFALLVFVTSWFSQRQPFEFQVPQYSQPWLLAFPFSSQCNYLSLDLLFILSEQIALPRIALPRWFCCGWVLKSRPLARKQNRLSQLLRAPTLHLLAMEVRQEKAMAMAIPKPSPLFCATQRRSRYEHWRGSSKRSGKSLDLVSRTSLQYRWHVFGVCYWDSCR